MALPVSGGNPVQILQDAVTAPAGLKVLPHNAAFQCTECSFVSRNASLFIRHMLQHKTQQSQASRAQVSSCFHAHCWHLLPYYESWVPSIFFLCITNLYISRCKQRFSDMCEFHTVSVTGRWETKCEQVCFRPVKQFWWLCRQVRYGFRYLSFILEDVIILCSCQHLVSL